MGLNVVDLSLRQWRVVRVVSVPKEDVKTFQLELAETCCREHLAFCRRHESDHKVHFDSFHALSPPSEQRGHGGETPDLVARRRHFWAGLSSQKTCEPSGYKDGDWFYFGHHSRGRTLRSCQAGLTAEVQIEVSSLALRMRKPFGPLEKSIVGTSTSFTGEGPRVAIVRFEIFFSSVSHQRRGIRKVGNQALLAPSLKNDFGATAKLFDESLSLALGELNVVSA